MLDAYYAVPRLSMKGVLREVARKASGLSPGPQGCALEPSSLRAHLNVLLFSLCFALTKERNVLASHTSNQLHICGMHVGPSHPACSVENPFRQTDV